MRSLAIIISLSITALLAPADAEAQGFRAEYYAGYQGYPNLPGPIVAQRVDTDVAFSSTGAVGTSAWNLRPGDRFTVRWTSHFTPRNPGPHRFTLESHDDGVLAIDGTVVVDLRGAHAVRQSTGQIDLAAGPHFVEIFYAESSGQGQIRLTHTPPGAAAAIAIPAAALDPAVRFGSAARTINFDAVAADTFLTDQFLSSHGVRFLNVNPAEYYYESRPTVTAAPTYPSSSRPNYLWNKSRGVEGAEEISGGVPLAILLTRPQQRVAINVGATYPWPNPPRIATLSAFDSSGRLVAASRSETIPLAFNAQLAVERATADIALIHIDFTDTSLGERVDDLILETSPTAPPAPVDTTPPAVRILTPAAGSDVASSSGGVQLRAEIRDASGVITDVIATSGTQRNAMRPETDIDPSCRAPACRIYTGGVVLPQGAATIRVTATDGAGNPGFADVNVRVVRGTTIHVANSTGSNVAGAEVYVNGVLHRQVTDAAGTVSIVPPLPAGTVLMARKQVFESASLRGSRWKFRVYNTSRVIASDGTASINTITDTLAVQELPLALNALIGLHVVVSIEWDASVDEMNNMRDANLAMASQALYEATDGQMFIEQVEIFDGGRNWEDADFRVYTDATLRANVDCRAGGFLIGSIFCKTWAHMSRSNWSYVYAHEFGHYGLDLYDEYADNLPIACTMAAPTVGGAFSNGTPSASCIMWNTPAKLCSNHTLNPHVRGTRQGDTSCWDHFARRFRDEERIGGFLIRWAIATPTTRNAIVPSVGAIPTPWRMRSTIDNAPLPNLCRPFDVNIVRIDNGQPAGGGEIWLRTLAGRTMLEGKTTNSPAMAATATTPAAPADIGRLRVTGVHLGDTIYGPSLAPMTVSSDNCSRF